MHLRTGHLRGKEYGIIQETSERHWGVHQLVQLGSASPQSVGQAARLETHTRVDTVVLNYNFFFSGKLFALKALS